MFRYDSDYTPPNADYTHDSEREHQLDTLATEVSKDLGLDYVAARAWARANLYSLLTFASSWDATAWVEQAAVSTWGRDWHQEQGQ